MVGKVRGRAPRPRWQPTITHGGQGRTAETCRQGPLTQGLGAHGAPTRLRAMAKARGGMGSQGHLPGHLPWCVTAQAMAQAGTMKLGGEGRGPGVGMVKLAMGRVQGEGHARSTPLTKQTYPAAAMTRHEGRMAGGMAAAGRAAGGMAVLVGTQTATGTDLDSPRLPHLH